MSKLFMYVTSLEGIEQLAVECTQSLLPRVEILDILGMRPTAVYFINRVRASMLMVPNFQPGKSGIVINNYFNCEGGVKECNSNMINVSNRCDICGDIHSSIMLNVDEVEYKNLIKNWFGKIKNYSLKDRLRLLTNNFKGEVFLNHIHKERFYNVLQKNISMKDISPRYIAILFLLTVDDML